MDDNQKLDIILILKLSAKYDFNNVAHLNAVLKSIRNNNPFKSRLGELYIQRLSDLTLNHTKDCFLCRKSTAYDGILCTSCMTKYSSGKLNFKNPPSNNNDGSQYMTADEVIDATKRKVSELSSSDNVEKLKSTAKQSLSQENIDKTKEKIKGAFSKDSIENIKKDVTENLTKENIKKTADKAIQITSDTLTQENYEKGKKQAISFFKRLKYFWQTLGKKRQKNVLIATAIIIISIFCFNKITAPKQNNTPASMSEDYSPVKVKKLSDAEKLLKSYFGQGVELKNGIRDSQHAGWFQMPIGENSHNANAKVAYMDQAAEDAYYRQEICYSCEVVVQNDFETVTGIAFVNNEGRILFSGMWLVYPDNYKVPMNSYYYRIR